MIPGIVAATIGSQSGGGDVYPDAVAVFDTILSLYSIDGVATTAAAMIDRPDLIDGSGLYIDWDVSGAFATAIGDFLTKLIAPSWTIVAEAIEENDTGNFPWLDVFAAATSHNAQIFTTMSSSFANITVTTPGVGGDAFAQVAVTDRPNLRRIAVTRTASKVVISANGSAIVSDTTSTTPSYDSARIGAQKGSTFPDMKGHIRRIIVYDPVSDSELPGLSA